MQYLTVFINPLAELRERLYGLTVQSCVWMLLCLVGVTEHDAFRQ